MTDYDPHFVPEKSFFLLGVKVILMNETGEILLLKRSSKLSRPLGWDFPGGGVDKGENFEMAAIRECAEETGLKVTDVELISSEIVDSGDDQAVIIGASATTTDKVVRLSWEHEEYKWMSLEAINNLELPTLHTKLLESYKNTKHGF